MSDIIGALRLEFSVKVNGNKYSLQLGKKKKKSYIIPSDSFRNVTFFIILIMEEKVTEELNTFSTSWSKYTICQQRNLTRHKRNQVTRPPTEIKFDACILVYDRWGSVSWLIKLALLPDVPVMACKGQYMRKLMYLLSEFVWNSCYHH